MFKLAKVRKRKSRTYKDGVRGKYKLVLATLVIRTLGLIQRFSDNSEAYWRNWSDFLDYRDFVYSTFSTDKLFVTRENLFEAIFRRCSGTEVKVFEYGVAYGYLVQHCLKHHGHQIEEWNGFDTFTGLPSGWRDLPQGYFSNCGVPPKIDDRRVNWYVGLVENTLTSYVVSKPSQATLHIFDLDLYAPSLFVWNTIKDQLKPGDILYFDEAFDLQERKLLIEHVLPFAEFELIGTTILALALRFHEKL
jgi:hypothetical protein